MDVKSAIEGGDSEGLRRLVHEDPACANGLVSWGKNCCILTHPLHYVSDMVFGGTLEREKAVLLVDVLIDAGAELDFQRDGKGDTPLIGAASLGVEEVGLRLLDAGAKPEVRGLFGETALHWAAMLGEDRLVRRLAVGTGIDAEDGEYHSPPLGWAIHGWGDTPAGNRGRHEECVLILAAAGAKVRPGWLESEAVRASPKALAALRASAVATG